MLYKHDHLLTRLREQGRSAPATILGMRTEGTYSDPGAMWADDSDLTKGGSLCRLELRVMPPGEPPFETTIRTRVNSFHYTGDTIEVLYDPADHDKVAFDYEADARAAMASARSPAPAAPSALAPLDPELQQLMDLEEAERTGGSGPPASASPRAPRRPLRRPPRAQPPPINGSPSSSNSRTFTAAATSPTPSSRPRRHAFSTSRSSPARPTRSAAAESFGRRDHQTGATRRVDVNHRASRPAAPRSPAAAPARSARSRPRRGSRAAPSDGDTVHEPARRV